MENQDTELKWPLNRPVSAHITIHYEEQNDGGQGHRDASQHTNNKVVKTVLNIDADTITDEEQLESMNVGPLREYSLKEACDQDTSETEAVVPTEYSPSCSRRASNANSMNVYDFYQCVHDEALSSDEEGSPRSACRYRYHSESGNNHFVARRFSEPKLPNTHHHLHRHQHRSSCAAAGDSPILRSASCAADMDPTLIRLPPLSTPRSPAMNDTGRSLSVSSSSSSSSTDGRCLDLSCRCARHHHRRNSVAVKFHKALYKKT